MINLFCPALIRQFLPTDRGIHFRITRHTTLLIVLVSSMLLYEVFVNNYIDYQICLGFSVPFVDK